MYLYSKLENYNKKIVLGIIGCGKFISMFLSQCNSLKNIHIDTIVDINVKKAKTNCLNSGLNKKLISSINFSNSINDILNKKNINIVVEATGNAMAGIQHASKAIKNSKNIIMVNVEADVVAGKYLSDLSKKYNVIYSMAYGDQPALIIEQIEWALANGFDVISAGKGTKYHESFKYSTPATVWENYGIESKKALKSGMNSKMFNSFITGDKSAIEMVAVVNGSHLIFPENGLQYPPVETKNLAEKIIPKNYGGLLNYPYEVEVVSCINERKRKIKNDLRWGVFTIIKGKHSYVNQCFKQYGIKTDSSGTFSALWRPYHYIGLELAHSVYSIALNKAPTGQTKFYKADVATIAKKDLQPGEKLDGEGGYTVRGEGVTAEFSKNNHILPLGLSDGAIMKVALKKDEIISFDMVEINLCNEILKARKYQYNLLKT